MKIIVIIFIFNNFKLFTFYYIFFYCSFYRFLFYQIIYAEVFEYDTNKDGKTDRWVYVQNGVVIKIEIDVNYDGKIDTIFNYANTDKGPYFN